MAVCAWVMEREEHVIAMGLHLMPWWYAHKDDIPDHLAEYEGVADAMDELHLRKIDLGDEIFVVNVDHYIGESTGREIQYAMSLGKKIRWYTNDPLGNKVQEIMTRGAKAAAENSGE